MTLINILEMINENFIHSREANGFHVIRQYMYKGNYIKYSEYVNLKKWGTEVKQIQHLGIKLSINDTFEIISLFTSKENTYFMNNLLTPNYRLSNSRFAYINYPILVSKSSFAEYITIVDEYKKIPENIKNPWLQEKNDLEEICKDALKSFNECANYYNLMNPMYLQETIAEYYLDLKPDSKFYKKIDTNRILDNLKYKDHFYYQNKIINENEIFDFIEKIKYMKGDDKTIKELTNNFKI